MMYSYIEFFYYILYFLLNLLYDFYVGHKVLFDLDLLVVVWYPNSKSVWGLICLTIVNDSWMVYGLYSNGLNRLFLRGTLWTLYECGFFILFYLCCWVTKRLQV